MYLQLFKVAVFIVWEYSDAVCLQTVVFSMFCSKRYVPGLLRWKGVLLKQQAREVLDMIRELGLYPNDTHVSCLHVSWSTFTRTITDAEDKG